MDTFTPTPPPPEPTATETPTVGPTVTPDVIQAKTNVQANLRAGPGVAYELVGFLEEGTEIEPVSRTANRLWLKLEDGIWIFAFLVSEVPSNLPLETNIPVPPPPPATATSPCADRSSGYSDTHSHFYTRACTRGLVVACSQKRKLRNAGWIGDYP